MINQEQEKNKVERMKIWIPLLLSLTLVGGMFVGMKMNSVPLLTVSQNSESKTIESVEIGKVEEIVRYIDARYVDDVEREELIEDAINNVLKDLDPHSNYISADQLKETNEQLEGNFDGVGIEFIILEDTILVVSPISGGPSEKVGIRAGDKIVQIEDSLIAGKDLVIRDIVNLLRGEKGTDVEVGILRGQEKTIRKFTITRDEIPLYSVDVALMLDDKTGFIKISRFSASTYREFMDELKVMVQDYGMKNLIIDVRQNPGGYLQEATNILSQLFDNSGKLLVYTEGRTVKRNDYESTGRVFYPVDSISILIDEGSASASEILAGAIQDWDRGPIIGRRSFGKGLVQEQYNLKGGGAIRLTVARYYTPSGRCIQKSYENIDDYDNDVYTRLESGELVHQDSIIVQDTSEVFYTNGGRKVYAGGGITPDVFIPIDTILLNNYYIQLRQHLPQFVYRYVESHQNDFEMSMEELENYEVTNEVLEEFVEYTITQGIDRNEADMSLVKESIRLLLKARIARQLFKEKGYYKIMNQNDPVVQAALNAMDGIRNTSPQANAGNN